MEPISKEKIDELKTKFGKIFKIGLGGRDYYIRQLKRGEYKNITDTLTENGTKAIKPEVHDEEVVKRGVVYPAITPDFFYESPAGDIPSLAVQVLERSGFTQNVTVEEV